MSYGNISPIVNSNLSKCNELMTPPAPQANENNKIFYIVLLENSG